MVEKSPAAVCVCIHRLIKESVDLVRLSGEYFDPPTAKARAILRTVFDWLRQNAGFSPLQSPSSVTTNRGGQPLVLKLSELLMRGSSLIFRRQARLANIFFSAFAALLRVEVCLSIEQSPDSPRTWKSRCEKCG